MNLDIALEKQRTLFLSHEFEDSETATMSVREGDSLAHIHLAEKEIWVLWTSLGTCLNRMTDWSYKSDDDMHEALSEKYENKSPEFGILDEDLSEEISKGLP